MPSLDFIHRSHCPACESPRTRPLLNIPFSNPVLQAAMSKLYEDVGRFDCQRVKNETYALGECTDCGLVFQVFAPDGPLMGDIYENWHDPEKTKNRWLAQLDPARRLEIAREVTVAWRLAHRPDTQFRVLDYGCGLGMWGGMAHAFGAETWGLEFSPSRKAHCAALGMKMSEEAGLPECYFDYIQLDQVLEHVVEPRKLMRQLLPLLRPGGVICVAVPQGRRVKKHLASWPAEFSKPNLGRLMPVVPLLHLNCFTHGNLRRLGESCGFLNLRPSLSQLLFLCGFSSGLRGLLKAVALPFYLRSGLATRIYLKRPDSA